MSVKLKLAVLVALQSLAILGMVGVKLNTLATGTQVILETAPIDPRSLFRGDYVRLRYVISTLSDDRIEYRSGTPEVGSTIYVTLRESDGIWNAVALDDHHPRVSGTDVVIRGRVAGRPGGRFLPAQLDDEGNQISPPQWQEPPANDLLVYYGIEAYFVPEGAGLALERPPEGQRLTVRVAVDNAGKAAISGVLLDGELVYEESLF